MPGPMAEAALAAEGPPEWLYGGRSRAGAPALSPTERACPGQLFVPKLPNPTVRNATASHRREDPGRYPAGRAEPETRKQCAEVPQTLGVVEAVVRSRLWPSCGAAA